MSKPIEITGSGCDKELAALAKKAEKGKADLQEIRELLDARPEVEKQMGSVAKQAEWAWVATYSGNNQLIAEASRRQLEEARKAIAGPNPSPLEQALAHRIVLCQVQLDHVDTIVATKIRAGLGSSALAMYQQWQDKAQARYLAAVKALAIIRRLAIPPVQVNVGEKQVNIAKMEVTGTSSKEQLTERNMENSS